MYRQYLHEKQMDGEWFLSRVFELPVVNSAVEQLTAVYSGVKEHNRVFRFTLDTAEGGMHMVYQTASPVLSKFDKPSKILLYWFVTVNHRTNMMLLCLETTWSSPYSVKSILHCCCLTFLL